MNENTIRAFEMLTQQQLTPAQVAENLGMAVHDVYLAKNRCLTKFREIFTQIESSFTELDA